MKKGLKLVTERPGTVHSPLALTFDAECKWLAAEARISMEEVMEVLSQASGITTTHLYNYRSGKTDIPASLVPVLCRHFESNALAMCIVSQCDPVDFNETDAMDVAQFTARTVKNMLAGGEVFIEAARDGVIDGHELIEIKHVMAKIVRDAHRVVEVATEMRRKAA